MAKKKWDYTDTACTRAGTMVCTACRKPIEAGQFRYRMTDAGFVTQHRNCSADDPCWAALDANVTKLDEFQRRRVAAYKAFVAEFGEPHDLLEPA